MSSLRKWGSTIYVNKWISSFLGMTLPFISMLQQHNRLKKKRDIEIVFEKGRFFGGAVVTLLVWPIDIIAFPKRLYTKDMCKIGFVVSKKVSKSAVKRNRVKRQMREVIRLYLKQEKLKEGVFLLVQAKPIVLDNSYQNIALDIERLLHRAKLLK